MNTSDSEAEIRKKIPTLEATAAVLLPGMRHARSLLDVSIQVLDYFKSQAAKDAAVGKCVFRRS